MPDVVHRAHNAGQADCTRGVVLCDAVSVHPVYMRQATQRKLTGRGEKVQRWRETCIRHWRAAAELTLEEVSERLSRHPYNLETGISHASLQRVENGLQMPKVELIEALAHLYKTDIHALLNLLPTIPQPVRVDYGDLAAIWDKAGPGDREKIVTIAKTILPQHN